MSNKTMGLPTISACPITFTGIRVSSYPKNKERAKSKGLASQHNRVRALQNEYREQAKEKNSNKPESRLELLANPHCLHSNREEKLRYPQAAHSQSPFIIFVSTQPLLNHCPTINPQTQPISFFSSDHWRVASQIRIKHKKAPETWILLGIVFLFLQLLQLQLDIFSFAKFSTLFLILPHLCLIFFLFNFFPVHVLYLFFCSDHACLWQTFLFSFHLTIFEKSFLVLEQ